jgi:diguanylate cyclase (GGDEF)-like protein
MVFGASADLGDELVEEQFAALARYMPRMYGVLCVLWLFFSLTFLEKIPTWELLGLQAAPSILCLARAVQWLHIGAPARPRSLREKRRAIYATALFACALCFAFAGAGLLAMHRGEIAGQALAMLFVWCAAIVSAFCLSVLPIAAGAVMVSATVPLVWVFMASGDPVITKIAPAIVVMTFSFLYILRENFHAFAGAARSRKSLEANRRTTEDARLEAVAMALSDALTGLPNRRAFDEELKRRAASDRTLAVAMLDLDGFKPINDVHGHGVGDKILIQVAERLLSAIGHDGFVARMGGDEFAILMEGLETPEMALSLARRAVRSIDAPFHHEAILANMRASSGVAFHRGQGDPGRLVERADIALYHAKANSRGDVHLFSEALEQSAQKRALIEQGLRAAIERDEFEVFFQPIIDLNSGEILSFEALARWRHPRLGEVAASEFIPVAERVGLIEPMTDRLLRKAARAASGWPAHVNLSFNLSATQVVSASAGLSIIATLGECGLPPSRFEAEVTETAILTDIEAARRTILCLKAAGVRVSLDDFGAGYSSLSQLRELPLDALKIDKSFIDPLCIDRKSADLVRSIIGLCANLDLRCVAEGVESEDQRRLLRDLGCLEAQGHLISPPVPLAEAEAMIAANAPRRALFA